MLIPKPRLVALTVLSLGAVAIAAGYWPPALARNDDANPKPAPGRMFVTGRVLDPNGKPVPGATVAVYARGLAPGRGPSPTTRAQLPIGDARADGSGRFRIDAPRTSSTRV